MIVVGPIPPPLGGFSYITGRMASLLNAQHPILLLDRSRKAGRTRLSTAIGFVSSTARSLTLLLAHLIAGRRGPLYLALSGGSGQWLDLIFLSVARPFRLPVFFHHHSFAYLDRPRRSASMLFLIAGSARHIVLCSRMEQLLIERYGLQPSRISILSNAAFLEPATPIAPTEHPPANNASPPPLVIGFLGNITEDKGIFDYVDVVASLEGTAAEVRGVIAGPVHATIRVRFDQAMANCNSIRYIGPVYDRAKEDFLESIDVLLFPSRYQNEAEPVTLLEALAHNVYVLTTDRGCCGSMIDSAAAGTVIAEAEFVTVARAILSDATRLRSCIRASGPLREFQRMQTTNRERLAKLLAQLSP